MLILIIVFSNYIKTFSNNLIPNIIHYAWLSENPKTDFVKNCIASWKKYSPNWLIIQWTIENILPFDNEFIEEAFKLQKYAFVADYIRVYALYNYGGVYIDSDVELKNSLTPFLNHTFFISQTRGKWLHVAPDCYGAVKGHPILKEMLDFYRSHPFKDNNGNLDETWVGIRFSQMIKKLYNIEFHNKITSPVLLPNNGSIYPTYYFELEKYGKINYANHYCTGSWVGQKYDLEKYLANCYFSCRNKTKIMENEVTCLKNDFINQIEVLSLLLVLICDMILKIFNIRFYKKQKI